MMKRRKLLGWKTKMESCRLLMDNSDTSVACSQYLLVLSLVIIYRYSGCILIAKNLICPFIPQFAW
jgi:hypothetical protein